MLEAAIVSSVLRTARGATPAGTLLRRVCVRIGVLTGVSPDAMRFFFDAAQAGQAQLELGAAPLRATCLHCGKHRVVREPTWSCPDCGIGVLNFENGYEFDLVATEVQDAGDDSNKERILAKNDEMAARNRRRLRPPVYSLLRSTGLRAVERPVSWSAPFLVCWQRRVSR